MAEKKAPAKTTVKKVAAKAVVKSATKKAAAKKTAAKTPVAATHTEIAALAHKYYVERGGHHGSDADDWLRAEKELLGR